MDTKLKAMIVSVGGTSAPVIFSLNKNRPDHICFFASKLSRKVIEEEILPNLNFKYKLYDWIVTANPESLSVCLSWLEKKLPEVLDKWEVSERDVCVDFTGGTKTMSVALALATVEKSCCYSYVGGDERSKGGVGVVIDGKEKMWFLENPWDVMAQKEKREVGILFNKARYASAAEVLEQCIDRVSRDQKPFLIALWKMVTGYDLWDRFKHQEAKKHLHKSRDLIAVLGTDRREIRALSEHLENNLEFLDGLPIGKNPSVFYFRDLMANSKRRAELEKKYDDAVARLYRAIEVLAQAELNESFGIDTSNVKQESIPLILRGEFVTKYQDKKDKKIKIPLYASYVLLKELENPLGREFFNVYEQEIRSLLDIRNYSILAHGFNPVGENTFRRLFESILNFSGTEPKDIPEFPALKI